MLHHSSDSVQIFQKSSVHDSNPRPLPPPQHRYHYRFELNLSYLDHRLQFQATEMGILRTTGPPPRRSLYHHHRPGRLLWLLRLPRRVNTPRSRMTCTTCFTLMPRGLWW